MARLVGPHQAWRVLKPFRVLLCRVELSFFLAFLSCQASAYERCYLEHKAAGNSSCFIASFNQTYSCIGPTKDDTVTCTTTNDEQVDCILKVAKLHGPREVWCDSPAITRSEQPVVTLVHAEPRRLVAERKNANSESSVAKGPVSKENCDAVITVGEGSWDYQSQYSNKVRCLKRKAAIEGRIPYENCSALLTADPGTWDEMFQQKRRQNCLDRQAGIEAIPQKRLICTPIFGLPGQSVCK